VKILVTSAASSTARVVAEALSSDHEVVLTDLPGYATRDVVGCDLNHDKATDDLVANIDVIVNVGYAGQSGSDTDLIDYHTRRIYNLLHAASEAGVARVINLSTLKLYQDHEENLVVTEKWRSDPSAEDAGLLAAHLCEYVVKEFARDQRIQAVNLRLGWPIAAQLPSSDTSAVSESAVIAAVRSALTSEDLEQWQDIHVQSHVEHQRFSTKKAEELFEGLAKELAR
jgi:nucleoside-diphosphate-sugar epimerase